MCRNILPCCHHLKEKSVRIWEMLTDFCRRIWQTFSMFRQWCQWNSDTFRVVTLGIFKCFQSALMVNVNEVIQLMAFWLLRTLKSKRDNVKGIQLSQRLISFAVCYICLFSTPSLQSWLLGIVFLRLQYDFWQLQDVSLKLVSNSQLLEADRIASPGFSSGRCSKGAVSKVLVRCHHWKSRNCLFFF